MVMTGWVWFQEGKTGQWDPSPITSLRWLLLAVCTQQDAKTHHEVQKSQTLTSDPASQPLSHVLFTHPALLPTKG